MSSEARSDIEVSEHVRPTDPAGTDVEPGTYRVVGASGEGVTLLRVGDADGRRVNTGEVVTVDAPLAGFEQADNPDGNRSLGAAVGSTLSGAYWSLRAFVTTLAGRPLLSALALAVLLGGSVGRGALPEPAPTVLILVGALALSLVGSGRL